MSFSNDSAEVIAFAAQIDLDEVKAQFEKLFIMQRYRDVMHIEMPKGHLFVFDYGVLVTWGVNPAKQEQYLVRLKAIAKEMNPVQTDKYQFLKADKEATQLAIIQDKLVLPNLKVDSLLALSHALAQSVKLQHFESRAEQTISSNQYLTTTLAKTGTSPLNRKALAKLRAQFFQTKSDILLQYRSLGTPEFVVNFPAMEHLYLDLSMHVALKARIELLNRKLQTIQDLYDLFAEEQNHTHFSFLAWTTIILITTITLLLLFK